MHAEADVACEAFGEGGTILVEVLARRQQRCVEIMLVLNLQEHWSAQKMSLTESHFRVLAQRPRLTTFRSMRTQMTVLIFGGTVVAKHHRHWSW